MAHSDLAGPAVSAASGTVRQLVVFLHGVGADGNDLIELAPVFAEMLPDADFLSPDAPFPYDMAPMGRQWFSLADRSPEALYAGVSGAAPLLDAYLDRELGARGLGPDRLALVGFSQGTMMALHVGLRRPAPAAILGYSGLLIAPEILPGDIRARPPVLLVHGEEDDVVPFAFQDLAVQALALVGITASRLSRPGLGHGIDEIGLEAGRRFVADAFAGS